METEPATRRRQRHRNEARRAILDAAESLLVEAGYEAFSMRRLAERSGYTTPSIYHHFNDKHGLIDALLEERFARLLRRVRRVPQGEDAVANLRALALEFVRFGLRHPTHYRLLLVTPRDQDHAPPPSSEELVQLFEKPMLQLAEQHRLAHGDPEAARQVIWALLHGLISLRTGLPDRDWSRSLLDVALDMMVGGLVRPRPEGGG